MTMDRHAHGHAGIMKQQLLLLLRKYENHIDQAKVV
jgi:hypothetical protein